MWSALDDDLFVIRAPGFEDFRAVLCSKASRSSDISTKKNMTQDDINTFLTQNLANYGHASIGEMSVPTVFHKGFSWLSAWFLEDNPLFIGQEMSTRVINPIKLGISTDSVNVNGIQDSFQIFADIFSQLKNDTTADKSTSYKNDEIRWALPGCVQSGVVMTMNNRIAVRHLNQLENAKEVLPFMTPVIKKYKQGMRECSPFVFDALNKPSEQTQPIQQRWKQLNYNFQDLAYFNMNKNELLKSSIRITKPLFLVGPEWLDTFKTVEPRKARQQYLDPDYKKLGLFSVEIICSIAAARDWHRHRSVMPWLLELVLNKKNNQPEIAPWFDQGEYKPIVKQTIKKHFQANNQWDSLLVLPFGTLVKLTCDADLPSLVYMLELRAYSTGANFEYQQQALSGLEQLRTIMGPDFCTKNQL